MPMISVIVPVYKVEPYLHRCVDSILNQTFSDFELILVDDGSPDGCPAICDEYARKDPRVRVIHQENGGLSAARNAGIDWAFANSDSQWLNFIDSDDCIRTTYLEVLLHNAQISDVNISCCNYRKFVMEPTEDVVGQMFPEILPTEIFWKRYPSPSVIAWAKLYRKELFSDIRYPVGRIWEDAYTTHKILFQCASVVWDPAGLYCYRNNEGSITHNVNLAQAFYRGNAYEEQAVFFHERDYTELRNIAVRRMLQHTQMAIAQAREESNKEFLKKTKDERSRQLNWARHELEIPLYANENIYEPAMPLRAKLSRAWRHFKRDIRKLIRR